MGSLSFVVKPKKQKLKLKLSKQTLISGAIILFSILTCFLLNVIIIQLNKNYVKNINMPAVTLNINLFYIVSAIVYVITGFSLFFSFKYENKFKELCVAILACFALNVVVCVCFFVFHSVNISTLLMVSNFVMCCYYIKLLKPKSLGQYLFIPYFLWNLFILFYLYVIYLVN